MFRRVPAPVREPPQTQREIMFRHISVRERDPSPSPPPRRSPAIMEERERETTVIDERTRETRDSEYYQYGDGYIYTRDLRGRGGGGGGGGRYSGRER